MRATTLRSSTHLTALLRNRASVDRSAVEIPERLLAHGPVHGRMRRRR